MVTLRGRTPYKMFNLCNRFCLGFWYFTASKTSSSNSKKNMPTKRFIIYCWKSVEIWIAWKIVIFDVNATVIKDRRRKAKWDREHMAFIENEDFCRHIDLERLKCSTKWTEQFMRETKEEKKTLVKLKPHAFECICFKPNSRVVFNEYFLKR